MVFVVLGAGVSSAYTARVDDDGAGNGAIAECAEENNAAISAPANCGKD